MGNGIKIPEHGSGSELFLSFAQQTSKESRNESKANNQTMSKINE